MLTREGAEIVRNSMLSAFTGLDIEKSTVIENEPPMDISAEEKQIRLDVNCITADGEKINIEMQARTMFGDNSENGHSNLCCRSIYYVSKLFIGQKVKYYNEMSRTFNIMVCDFPVFDDEKFIHRFHYRDGELTLNDITCIIYVELPKIKKAAEKSFPEMTPEERWAFLIEYADDKKFFAKAKEFTAKETIGKKSIA
jgi:predicted transposase/invertase (TIGR01784 family)